MSEHVAFTSFVDAIAHAEALQKVQHERDEYKKLYTHVREENERLKRGLLGKKAEKLPPNDAQLSLAILGLMLGGDKPAPPPADEEPTRVIPEHTRKLPKRRDPSCHVATSNCDGDISNGCETPLAQCHRRVFVSSAVYTGNLAVSSAQTQDARPWRMRRHSAAPQGLDER